NKCFQMLFLRYLYYLYHTFSFIATGFTARYALVSLDTASSICPNVWVAIRDRRINVASGGTAGETTGFTNMPSSCSIFVMRNVFALSLMYMGIIGVSVMPMSKPSSFS